MTYLLMYDISDNRLRKKIADCLIREGYERLQLSVFIGNTDLPKKSEVWNRLTEWIQKDSGKMAMVSLTELAIRNMVLLGSYTIDVDYFLGKKFCIFV